MTCPTKTSWKNSTKIMVDAVFSIPRWLETLLAEKFFMPCTVHECTKKNEKNIFCLDCCSSICTHCFPPHRLHCLLQIRRYIYHDVIRLSDAQKLVDCSLVQSYTTNSEKVVFLKPRPLSPSRTFRTCGNLCVTCDRTLQHPYLFCSLFCKVHHLAALKNGTTNDKDQKQIQEFELVLQLPNREKPASFSTLADDQITPNSVLDLPVSLFGSTTSISSDGGKNNCTTALVSYTASTEFAKKKKKKKSVPQRSPFY